MSDAAGLADLTDLIDASEAPAQDSVALVDADIVDASVTSDAAAPKVQDRPAEQPMQGQEAEDSFQKQVATKAADVSDKSENGSSSNVIETAGNEQSGALHTVSSSGSKLTAAEEPATDPTAEKGLAEDRRSSGGATGGAVAAAASLVELADSNGNSAGNAASDLEAVKPQRSVSELRKQLTSVGGSSPSAADAVAAATAAAVPAAASPVSGGERSSSPILSPHDKVNTTNAAALLQASEFKLRPGMDEVPYEQLVGLRLEDGIDVTRKEEYLSAEEFKKVMGVDQDAYSKLPQWKKLQIKRQVNLF